MADVFLSYARKESERAEQIKRKLEELGVSVFFDVDGLDGGDVFPDVLDREVKSAGAVIGLWSPYALSRPWVKQECSIGFKRKILIPVSIEPLGDLDLPVAFEGIQLIDLTTFTGNADDPAWKKLVKSLARTLKRPDLVQAAQASAIQVSGKEQAPDFRLAWLGAAGFLLSLAVGAIAWYYSARAPVDRLVDDLREINFLDPKVDSVAAWKELRATHSIASFEAAAQRDAKSALVLGRAYQDGLDVKQDKTKARDLFKMACDRELLRGCVGLGVMYANGDTVEQSHAKALGLYKKACDGGELRGCNNLANAYLDGLGVAKSDQSDGIALALLDKGCSGGELFSCHALGGMYLNGRGVARDYKKASALYQRACDAGQLMSCANLGFVYIATENVAKDYGAALLHFKRACAGGVAIGCAGLGELYFDGLGVTTNFDMSRQFYQVACDGGSLTACESLGTFYHAGRSVAQDYATAEALYKKACAGGVTSACDRLKKLPAPDARGVQTVLLVRGEGLKGEKIYAYVQVPAIRLEEFISAQQKGVLYPEEYGKILASGTGEPDSATQSRMERDFKFNHQGMFNIRNANEAAAVAGLVESAKRSTVSR